MKSDLQPTVRAEIRRCVLVLGIVATPCWAQPTLLPVDLAPDHSSSASVVSADQSLVAFRRGTIEPPHDSSVFLKDLRSGVLKLVSHVAGQVTEPAKGEFDVLGFFGRDRYLLLRTSSTNLLPELKNTVEAHLVVYDRQSAHHRLVTRSAAREGEAADRGVDAVCLSDLGQKVHFLSRATNLVDDIDVAGDHSQVYRCDLDSGACSLLTISALAPASAANDSAEHVVHCSRDGRSALFMSRATDLVTGSDGNDSFDVYLFREGQSLRRLSRSFSQSSSAADGSSWAAALSHDGRFALFNSMAPDLIPDFQAAANGTRSAAYLHDVELDSTEMISRAFGVPELPGQVADAPSWGLATTRDGRYVLFSSLATNLVEGQLNPTCESSSGAGCRTNLFLRDRRLHRTHLVTRAFDQPQIAAGYSSLGYLAESGPQVLLIGANDRFVEGTSIDSDNIFWFDLETETMTLISHRFDAPFVGSSTWPSFSGPGRNYFGSLASLISFRDDLSPLDNNGAPDAYLARLPRLFQDGFERGDLSSWSEVVPVE